jgi:serine/threonine protein kinase
VLGCKLSIAVVTHPCLCCVAAPQAALLRRCADIAAGVTYLHSRNVCHGDLKCENTLLRTGEGCSTTTLVGVQPQQLGGTALHCMMSCSNLLAEGILSSTQPNVVTQTALQRLQSAAFPAGPAAASMWQNNTQGQLFV